MHEQRKQTVTVHRLRRRVREFERQAAPWPWRNRARRQLRKVEGRKEQSHAGRNDHYAKG